MVGMAAAVVPPSYTLVLAAAVTVMAFALIVPLALLTKLTV